MITQIMIYFPQILVWPVRPYVFAPNLNSFEPLETELTAKEVGEFSIMLHGKMGWWAFSCRVLLEGERRCGLPLIFEEKIICVFLASILENTSNG